MVNLQSWLVRAVALLVAWNAVLALAAIAGSVIGLRIWPLVVFWLWFGLLQMLGSPGNHPLPHNRSVDVMGALAMLWWAAKWPARMFRR